MSEPFIGLIAIMGFNYPPRGWATCDGQLLPIAQYTALFSLLGTTYGGDGRTNFALPDLRGRVAIHRGQGSGLNNRVLGERAGAESHTLSVAEMPGHTHALGASSAPGTTVSPSGAVFAGTAAEAPAYATGAGAVTAPLASAGGNQPHENRQPFLVVNYCISLEGIFPSRP